MIKRIRSRKSEPTPTRVGVVGFGFIGGTLSAVLAERGCYVVAVDHSASRIHDLKGGFCLIPEPGLHELIRTNAAAGRLTFSTEFSAIADVDVVLITVGTPLSDNFEADLSHIRSACEAIAPHLQDGQLVILKSTVPPGVTRGVVSEILRAKAKIQIAFSPERLAEGQAIHDVLTLPVVVGGIDEVSTEMAASFWQSSLGVEVIKLSSPETAELVKLAGNMWIDLNIALAHELAKLCDALPYQLDVLEIIKAANSLKKGQHYVNILAPSNGVGGYCLTKDPWFLCAIGKEHGVRLDLPRASRTVNDSMPSYVARQIERHFARAGIQPSDGKVAVMGLAFKSNSGDLRLTPVYPFLQAMKRAGFVHLVIHDPLVIKQDAQDLGLSLIGDWREALHGAHCAAFFVGHDEFKNINPESLASLLAPGALIFDGRMYFSRQAIGQMNAAGLVYRGIGR